MIFEIQSAAVGKKKQSTEVLYKKKTFWKILQNSCRENNCTVASFFNKKALFNKKLEVWSFIEKETQTQMS